MYEVILKKQLESNSANGINQKTRWFLPDKLTICTDPNGVYGMSGNITVIELSQIKEIKEVS